MKTLINTRWIRLKLFPNSSFSWVFSLGSRDGRRLNVSWHHKPKADSEAPM